jgi:hypothetical protein
MNLQLQRQRCSRLESFYIGEKYFFLNLKTCRAINSAVDFYNDGVVTRDRRIGSRCEKLAPSSHPDSLKAVTLVTRPLRAGSYIIILKIFSPTILTKKWRFFTYDTASLCKK